MDASTIAGLVVSGVLTALLVAVLRSGTVRGAEQRAQHAENSGRLQENSQQLQAIVDDIRAINGRVRATETSGAADVTDLRAHIELDREVRRLTEAAAVQLRQDVNDLRADVKALLTRVRGRQQ